MNRLKLIFAFLGAALLLSCSEDLKPIERESLEEYQSRLGSSSSSEVANISSSSDAGSSSSLLSSSSGEEANPSSSSEEQKVIVSGVSQKGPFLNNSSVVLYELRSNLVQTGRSFQGMTDEKGSFEIKGIELASPYALLKADGFYRNEVSGENSIAPITLYAIADMTDKNSANVNILTHLEHYRVQALVEGGKSLAEAKKQALGEILAVFGIEGNGFKGSEEMSIFGTGDGDAAMLAISILLQSNLSEGSFLALLADFSQGLKESGKWSDKAKLAGMAEWASSADLSAIRINILGWQLSSNVPNFEKYIRAYVSANSGTEDCAGIDSENEFCHNGRIYAKCGDANGNGKQDYNPVTQFCYNNSTVSKCGGKEYLPLEEVCNSGVVGKLCGTGGWYDPSIKYCLENNLYSCNEKPYNPASQFCHINTTIYDKCGGTITYAPGTEQCCGSNKYATATQFCLELTVYNKCGSNEYNPSTHYCHSDNKTYTCGNKPYDPSTHFCLSNAITSLCGGKTFTATQFCHTNAVYSKCGSSEYNPSTHYCHSDNKTYSCGNKPYDPSTHFCLSNAITSLCGGKTFTATQFCHTNTIYSKCGGTVTYVPGTEQCCGNNKYALATQFCYNSSKVGSKCGTRTEIFDPDLYECRNTSKIYLKSKVRDAGNNEYDAVLIGTQTWMAKNLNYNTSYSSGHSCYDNNDNNCVTYGRLYNWETAKHQSTCPDGWHLPNQTEWDVMLTYIGDNGGKKLRASSGWCCSNGNGTDDYGFSALPGGRVEANKSMGWEGSGDWWSASESSGSKAYLLYMDHDKDWAGWNNDSKSNRYSVRCLKD